MAVHTGLGFEPGRQRVPHAGHEQPGRGLRDDVGIHDDQVGILAIEPILVEDALRRVDDGQRAARRVARRDGRTVDDGKVHVVRGRAGRIQYLPAAGADDYLRFVLGAGFLDTLDLRVGTFAAELVHDVLNPCVAQMFLPDFGQEALRALAGNDQRRPLQADPFHFGAQGSGRMFALHVMAWCRKDRQHDFLLTKNGRLG